MEVLNNVLVLYDASEGDGCDTSDESHSATTMLEDWDKIAISPAGELTN